MTTQVEAETELALAQAELARVEAAVKRHELLHKDASDKKRIYHFPSVVVAETIDTCMEVLQHWIDIDPTDEMTVAFNSPGGLVFPGFALYDFIADHVENGIAIHTTSYGYAASMASVTLQAGKTRSLHRNAALMIHEVSYFGEGPLQSMKDQLAFVDKLQARAERILVSRTNPGQLTQDELHEKTKHLDWWLTPEEALEIGFIDFIAK